MRRASDQPRGDGEDNLGSPLSRGMTTGVAVPCVQMIRLFRLGSLAPGVERRE